MNGMDAPGLSYALLTRGKSGSGGRKPRPGPMSWQGFPSPTTPSRVISAVCSVTPACSLIMVCLLWHIWPMERELLLAHQKSTHDGSARAGRNASSWLVVTHASYYYLLLV